jgi:hypothetical protein
MDVNETHLKIELKKLFNYTELPELRREFIDDVHSMMPSEKYELYFNNDYQVFTTFMSNVLALIAVDPTLRIPKEILLQDPFFHK